MLNDILLHFQKTAYKKFTTIFLQNCHVDKLSQPKGVEEQITKCNTWYSGPEKKDVKQTLGKYK